MAQASGFDYSLLKLKIRNAFGIDVEVLEALPLGFVGRHYEAVASSGKRYFLTLYDDERVARIAANNLDFTISLVHRLCQSGRFSNLLPPLYTADGAMWAEFNDWPLLVYPYLDGHLLAEEMPLTGETMAELGGIVGRLHASSSLAEGLFNAARERFTFHFEAPLRQGLRDLAALSQGGRGGPIALREMLLPQKEMVLRLLERLHALAEPLRRSPPPFVICHTDIHPWNIFRQPDGRLIVIDWDGVCLAPAEHDLFIFSGEGFETFLQAYYQSGGRRNLSARTFAFYFFRRNLEDLADFVYRLLNENLDTRTEQAYLEGTQELMVGWADLENAEIRMQAILTKV